MHQLSIRTSFFLLISEQPLAGADMASAGGEFASCLARPLTWTCGPTTGNSEPPSSLSDLLEKPDSHSLLPPTNFIRGSTRQGRGTSCSDLSNKCFSTKSDMSKIKGGNQRGEALRRILSVCKIEHGRIAYLEIECLLEGRIWTRHVAILSSAARYVSACLERRFRNHPVLYLRTI